VRRLTLTVDRLGHTYPNATAPALTDVSFSLPPGSAAAVMGPSGSGKSTLALILAGLQRPTSGTVHLGDTDLTALPESALLDVRALHLAAIVQRPERNLLGYATALDNLDFAQRGPRARHRVDLPEPRRLLADLGLGPIADRPVDRLSGGERQRLALAAGLAIGPDVLLADEPTSQLDAGHVDAVLDLLSAAAEDGVTVIAITHDERVAARMRTVLTLHEGRLVP
jgi:putative ABC transport system ATP-binding protein